MDRSFLSDPDVVKATRDFVCMRLATYEDAEEAKYLATIYTRHGVLENTVFAVLAPDGKTQLSRPGRRPSYRRPSQMAESMSEIVEQNYKDAPTQRWTNNVLPEMKSLDLAINVASCDRLPLIVAVGDTPEELAEIRKSLLPTAWSEELAGQFVFASILTSGDLRPLHGMDDGTGKTGAFIVVPDTFGLSGRFVARLVDEAEGRSQQIREFLADFEPPRKTSENHVQSGFALGLKWETAIPVTDSQAARASRRLWGSKD